MPKIGCQLRQQLLNVCAGAIPADQPMNGRRVSNIVDARLVSRGGLSLKLGGLANPAKLLVDTLVVQMNPCARRKEC